jgi:hypothetical protein
LGPRIAAGFAFQSQRIFDQRIGIGCGCKDCKNTNLLSLPPETCGRKWGSLIKVPITLPQ